MRGFTQEVLEATRPQVEPLTAVNFCLGQLYAEPDISIEDPVAGVLTYEELIGALLLARDKLEGL